MGDERQICTVERTLDVIGDRWTVLILRDAFYGVRRFHEFVEDLGIARNVLTDRLKRLVEHGVLERQRYEDRPPRDEYRLTPKGKELLPVLLTLMRWGDRWTIDGEPEVAFRHEPCGQVVEAAVVCDHCGQQLARRDLRLIGPSPLDRMPRRIGAS